ncbi:hypothetical protein IQ274_31575 [Nostoc sp. LEGE 12447]|uniref:hypothetical protein n=1 Tax=Nostoc sp. LEGE 12447 TaxID=1828640 RepID=UPI0018845F50|nr:hypothetical protein [Nostoc sp. LEGE 12447]MBE9002604.1 hypothetical protein [Nostoc sp. LEGE 12447]
MADQIVPSCAIFVLGCSRFVPRGRFAAGVGAVAAEFRFGVPCWWCTHYTSAPCGWAAPIFRFAQDAEVTFAPAGSLYPIGTFGKSEKKQWWL